jgi:hypothetical protein
MDDGTDGKILKYCEDCQKNLQRRQEPQHPEYRGEPLHPCVLFHNGWHCSPMAEFSGSVAELPKVGAELHLATPGLLPGGRSLGRNECRSRWLAQRRPTGYKSRTGTLCDWRTHRTHRGRGPRLPASAKTCRRQGLSWSPHVKRGLQQSDRPSDQAAHRPLTIE